MIKLIGLLLVVFLKAEQPSSHQAKIPVVKIMLFTKEASASSALRQARQLLDKDLDVYVHLLIKSTDNLEQYLNLLGANTIKSETFLRFLIAGALLQPPEGAEDRVQREIEEIFNQTVEKILSNDKGFLKTADTINRVSFDYEGSGLNLRKDPTWLVETTEGIVLLEGFNQDITKYFDFSEKKLNLEKLRQDLEVR